MIPKFLRSARPLRHAILGGLSLLFLVGVSACDSSGPTVADPIPERDVAVVVNSMELSLTVFELDDPTQRRTIPLGPEGSPVGAAVRGSLAAVPLGLVPAVVLVDLREGIVTRTVALPQGSGATGAHFVNDSIVLVGNPGRGTVSPVNALRGTTGPEIPVGRWGQVIVEAGGRIFVVNSELGADFQPDGTGTLTVLDAGTLQPTGTVALSGENSGHAVEGPDGLLYVVNAGRWGESTGSLSVVDPASATEVDHVEGFGDFPESAALAGDGRLYVSSWSFGVIAWAPATGTFHRGPGDAIAPDGVPSAAGLGADPAGNLWTLFPDCSQPSRVLRLGPGYEVEVSVPVGVCPAAIRFTTVPEPED